jgi:hypothetical protein
MRLIAIGTGTAATTVITRSVRFLNEFLFRFTLYWFDMIIKAIVLPGGLRSWPPSARGLDASRSRGGGGGRGGHNAGHDAIEPLLSD